MKQLKSRLKKGELLWGCWLNLGSPITAEMVGLSGYDWVLIDLEHGSGGEKDTLYQLQALEHTPAAALVRVESFQRQRFHRVLDFGAEGVMCPRINNADEAKLAADALRYQPQGMRGVAQMIRATQYSANFKSYYDKEQHEIVGVIQIETDSVLNHIDQVAAVDGVDVLFIGPTDLSMALGVFGDFDHPRFMDALKLTAEAARKAGKALGVLMPNPGELQRYHALGFRFIACGADLAFVHKGAKQMIEALNKQKEQL